MLSVSIGRAWRMQLLRRLDGGQPVITRGVVALGDVAPGMQMRGDISRGCVVAFLVGVMGGADVDGEQ